MSANQELGNMLNRFHMMASERDAAFAERDALLREIKRLHEQNLALISALTPAPTKDTKGTTP